MSMASLEALAIHYLIDSVWSWIAFLTAALSYWKLNSSPPSSSPSPQPHHLSPNSTSPAEPDPDQQELPPTTTSSTAFCTLENRRSSKFKVYYAGEDDSRAIGRKKDWRITGSVIRHNPGRLDDGWEALLKLKTAEMGWYRYQDLTLLNGSVVQLWNHQVVVDY